MLTGQYLVTATNIVGHVITDLNLFHIHLLVEIMRLEQQWQVI